MSSDESSDTQIDFSEYIDQHKVAPRKVEKYRKLSNIQDHSVPIIGSIIAIAMSVLTVLLFFDVINIPENDDFSNLAFSAIVAIGSSAFIIFTQAYIQNLTKSHELDEETVARHELALAAEACQDADWDKALNHIEILGSDVKNIAHPTFSSINYELVNSYETTGVNTDAILKDVISEIIEDDKKVMNTKDLTYHMLSVEDDYKPVTYREIIVERLGNRSGLTIRLTIAVVIGGAVLFVYFTISQSLAGVLAALAALLGIVFPQRE